MSALTRIAAAAVVATTVVLAASPLAPAAPAAPAVPAGADAPSPTDAEHAGRIAYYGKKFQGRRTASGERFDAGKLTMAHRTLPFGTRVRITNPANGRSVVVRVNDRGPQQRELAGDVSLAAARKLGFVKQGVLDARLEVLDSPDERTRTAEAPGRRR